MNTIATTTTTEQQEPTQTTEIDDLDPTDWAYLNVVLTRYNAQMDTLPRVGDWLRFPSGEFRRVASVWSDHGLQPCGRGSASFYFGKGIDDAYVSHSGGLDPELTFSQYSFALSPDTRAGVVWFFKGGIARAHNGVYVRVPFRVFEVLPK